MTAMIIMIIILVSNDNDEKQQQLSVWLQCARLLVLVHLVHLNFRIGHWYYLHSAAK